MSLNYSCFIVDHSWLTHSYCPLQLPEMKNHGPSICWKYKYPLVTMSAKNPRG